MADWVSVIQNGSNKICEVLFESIDIGDIFFSNGVWHRCGVEAHYSGDASYDGYLLYDDIDEGWFPEELDDGVELSDEEIAQILAAAKEKQ